MTENDRIKFKDEIERIGGIPTERIYNLDFKKLQKLTADFKEPLVKLILSKIKTCEGQTEMLRFLKNKYEEELFFIGVPTSEISAPEYFSSLEFDLECNRLITIEGIVSAPVMYPIESSSDEKSGTEVKARKWLKLYSEKTSTPPDISKLMARIEELEAENKELKKKQTILKEVEEQEEKEQQVSTGEDASKLQALIKELEAKLKQVTAEKEMLQQELNVLQSPEGASIDIEGHSAVRLELLRLLMDKDGAQWEKHGNKVIAARLMEAITGLALKTCKNHLSDPNVNQTEHQQEILEINSKLQALGMSIRL